MVGGNFCTGKYAGKVDEDICLSQYMRNFVKYFPVLKCQEKHNIFLDCTFLLNKTIPAVLRLFSFYHTMT